MKKIILAALFLTGWQLTPPNSLFAQTEVTDTYIDNPNFEGRFAGWTNNGMYFQTSKAFDRQNGMVFMEKWVNQGSKVGGIVYIKQTLVGLPAGTYTLLADAQNIQQNSTAAQTGAFIFAGNEQTEVSASNEYSVTFTVLGGQAEIGFKTSSCTGNWVCVDNFRLFYKGIVKDSVNLELQRLITEAEGVIGDGATAASLQTAIDNAKALLTAEGDYQAAATALAKATLTYRISNATGAVPTVTTYDFVPTGVTIALGRSTISGASVKERGFCWSTNPNPTVLDNRSTRYFSNNGFIYCMEHMQPATVYYVRAYAITSGWQVGYGDVVKIATLPESNMTTWYDNAGDEQQNYRIASAVNEVEWLYHNLTNVRDFGLSVHYSYGSGAGGGTADCSYGGYMRVSQNTPYQQTGTILHETNHGVGVGTTNEWKNNSNLRSETTRGLWLGPRANLMVKFLENNPDAVLNGDGTHMWPYGINGANEDTYNPENTILYFGNIMTTHALHHDGLICSSGVGFATPAYLFAQEDDAKYYIKSEVADYGLATFLGHTATGALKNITATPQEALADDGLAWYIRYNPKTGYYTFQNAESGKYLGLSSTTIKALSSPAAFHLLPSREQCTLGDFTKSSYWITLNKGTYALKAGTSSCSTVAFDHSNTAASQRWLFLTSDDLAAYETGALDVSTQQLTQLIANIRATMATPHVANADTLSLNAIDQQLADTLAAVEGQADAFTTSAQVAQATASVQDALVQFLGSVTPASVEQPFDLTYLLTNATIDDNSGWSDTPTFGYSCCEYFTRASFDFNQTTAIKMPKGTYKVRMQGFQRPGAYADVYTDYVTNGVNNVKAVLYAKTKSTPIKNIFDDAQPKSLGTGSVAAATKVYIPNTMESAQAFFSNGLYDNSVTVTTTTLATFKLGLRCAAVSANYWTCFDNFRLCFYGSLTSDEVTPVQAVEADARPAASSAVLFDLQGRHVTHPRRGIYIRNGKKIILK